MDITLKQLIELQLPLQLRIDALEEQIKALQWLQHQLLNQIKALQDGTARHGTNNL